MMGERMAKARSQMRPQARLLVVGWKMSRAAESRWFRCRRQPRDRLRRYNQARLSLVQLRHYCALIGRELHSDEIFS